jgi:hypothetical protein
MGQDAEEDLPEGISGDSTRALRYQEASRVCPEDARQELQGCLKAEDEDVSLARER